MSNPQKTSPPVSGPKTPGRPNLRHYHRVNTQFDARIESEDALKAGGQPLQCQLTNLSRAGVMAVCEPDMIKTLLPKGAAIGPRQSARVRVQFEIPVINVQNVLIEAQCDVIYLRRVSRNSFQLGMSFVAFDNNGRDYIDQYIDRKLHPPGE